MDKPILNVVQDTKCRGGGEREKERETVYIMCKGKKQNVNTIIYWKENSIFTEYGKEKIKIIF